MKNYNSISIKTNSIIKKTYQIHLEGIVQGVGFRPFVYNLAKKLNLNGWVANTSIGVFIRINSNDMGVNNFLKEIIANAPSKAIITDHKIKVIDDEVFDTFSINDSFETENGKVFLPPDFAMCSDCEKELLENINRRFNYPFITCTSCGPRYSIIRKLPYDRELTTMGNFEMCDKCNEEYSSTDNHRFYSQTNSCSDCGVELSLYNGSQEKKGNYDALINEVVQKLEEGGIVAVKGIGGYLILTDATNSASIKKLRQRKNRPSKPFALMVKDEDWLTRHVKITKTELESWKSAEAEIILFKTGAETVNKIVLAEIAPNLSKVGIMRPYAPLLKIITDKFNKPLIATSANLSGSPIIYKDDEAIKYLPEIADLILLNNREILIPQDDSVVQFSKKGTRIVLRRSRGIAPNYFGNPISVDSEIIAVGSMLKSTFAFYKNQQFYISQYLGNTDYLSSQTTFKHTYNHLKNILNANSKTVVCDLHPDYFSTEFAEEIAKKENVNIVKIQHHEAHFMAVVGENNLVNDKVLGFVWDGTGLGNDGEIWGGEVFQLKNKKVQRLYHSTYHKHILGDKMVNEPRLSGLSFFSGINGSETLLKSKFTKNEYKYYSKAVNESTLQTSSMGRFFDAVASILSLKEISEYEGEAAMILETIANNYSGDVDELKAYGFDIENRKINFEKTKSGIIKSVNKNRPVSEIAFRFHLTLVNVIEDISKKENTKNIAFSGGVFQNALLVSLIEEKLGEKYNLYFHKQLSPNDECIPFGQIVRFSLMDTE